MTLSEIQHGESSELEFKRELPKNKDNLLKTVSAFSNGGGGSIIIGIDDKTHEVVGVDEIEAFKMMDAIANSISDGIEPLVSPDISLQTVDGKTVIRVRIFAGSHTPYYLKSFGKDSGTFVRIAATSRLADAIAQKELELLGMRHSYDSLESRSFMNDEQSFNTETTKKLCDDIMRFMKQKTGSSIPVNEQTLKTLGVLKEKDGKFIPTNAYAILMHPDRYEYLWASIRCACFKGTEKVNFLDRLDCEGSLYEQIEQALKFVLKNLRTGMRIEGAIGKDVYEIPPLALREAIVNAVAHRNYMLDESVRIAVFDDRVEITSPGLLPAGISLASALNGESRLRNPVIAKVLHMMGFMEEWGSGLRRIAQECVEYNVKRPILAETEIASVMTFSRNVVVNENVPQNVLQGQENVVRTDDNVVTNEKNVVRTDDNVAKNLSKAEQSVFDILKKDNSYTAKEIADILKMSSRQIQRIFASLKEKGCIKHEGATKGGHWEIIGE